MTNGMRRLQCFVTPAGCIVNEEGTIAGCPAFLCQVWLTPMPDETMPTVVACVSFGLN
jgi:hypothetical protein